MKNLLLLIFVLCCKLTFSQCDLDFTITDSTALSVTFFYPKSSYSGVYFWDFGDVNVSNVYRPSNIYPDTGAYEATLILTSRDSICIDTFFQKIHIGKSQYRPNFTYTKTGRFIEYKDSTTYDPGSTPLVGSLWDFGDLAPNGLIRERKGSAIREKSGAIEQLALKFGKFEKQNSKNMLKINEIKEKVIPILERHEVRHAGIFGSYAINEATKDSDVDILIELKENSSLLDFVEIKLELEDVLGIKVDLVEYQAIKPALRELILEEEVKIYDQETYTEGIY